MNMLDMMRAAQGGQAMANLGQQFGLDDAQAEQAVRALLPALSSGLKRNTGQGDGVASLLQALKDGRHEGYYDDPAMIAAGSAVSEGNGILGHILGSKDVSRAAAERASASTGIGSEILKQMLPIIASMVMGALTKRTRQPDFGDILGSVLGGGGSRSGGSGGMLGGILGKVLSGALGGGRQAGAGRSGGHPGADIFGSMLDADGDGSMADDLFDIARRTMR